MCIQSMAAGLASLYEDGLGTEYQSSAHYCDKDVNDPVKILLSTFVHK